VALGLWMVVLHLHHSCLVLLQLPLDRCHHLERLSPHLELGVELVWRMVDIAVVEVLMGTCLQWACFSMMCLEPPPHLFHHDQLALFESH
jgi:hypothetical protein